MDEKFGKFGEGKFGHGGDFVGLELDYGKFWTWRVLQVTYICKTVLVESEEFEFRELDCRHCGNIIYTEVDILN